jgi:hypothetical protein
MSDYDGDVWLDEAAEEFGTRNGRDVKQLEVVPGAVRLGEVPQSSRSRRSRSPLGSQICGRDRVWYRYGQVLLSLVLLVDADAVGGRLQTVSAFRDYRYPSKHQ